MAKSSFFHHAVVYGLGNALLYATGIVLLPLYTSWFDPREYGLRW